MNDRIKEIIEEINNKYQDYYLDDFLSGDDVKLLVDYLNNSQEEIKRLNNIIFKANIQIDKIKRIINGENL